MVTVGNFDAFWEERSSSGITTSVTLVTAYFVVFSNETYQHLLVTLETVVTVGNFDAFWEGRSSKWNYNLSNSGNCLLCSHIE